METKAKNANLNRSRKKLIGRESVRVKKPERLLNQINDDNSTKTEDEELEYNTSDSENEDDYIDIEEDEGDDESEKKDKSTTDSLTENPTLESEKLIFKSSNYYFPDINREKAEKLIEENKDTYLIRPSSVENCIALSHWNTTRSEAIHFLIQFSDKQYKILDCEKDANNYPSLDLLTSNSPELKGLKPLGLVLKSQEQEKEKENESKTEPTVTVGFHVQDNNISNNNQIERSVSKEDASVENKTSPQTQSTENKSNGNGTMRKPPGGSFIGLRGEKRVDTSPPPPTTTTATTITETNVNNNNHIETKEEEEERKREEDKLEEEIRIEEKRMEARRAEQRLIEEQKRLEQEKEKEKEKEKENENEKTNQNENTSSSTPTNTTTTTSVPISVPVLDTSKIENNTTANATTTATVSPRSPRSEINTTTSTSTSTTPRSTTPRNNTTQQLDGEVSPRTTTATAADDNEKKTLSSSASSSSVSSSSGPIPIVPAPRELNPNSIKVKDYKNLIEKMKAADSGLAIKDRKQMLKTYKNCFIGGELLEWLEKNYQLSSADSIKVAGKLMTSGFMTCLTQTQVMDVTDKSKNLYTFQEPDMKQMIHLNIKEADNIGTGESKGEPGDPYIQVKWCEQQKVTQKQKKTFNPIFNETMIFQATELLPNLAGKNIELRILDKGTLKKHSHLGEVIIPIDILVEGEETLFKTYKLDGVDTGTITLTVTAVNFGHQDTKSSLNYQLLHLNPKVDCSKRITELVEAGCDINAIDEQGNTAAHIFADKNAAIQNLDTLIEKGADVNIKDKEGRNPLHISVLSSGTQQAKLLLEKGKVSVDVTDKDQKTSLHLASSYKLSSLGEKNPVLPILLEFKANINAVDSQGNTPLHYAARIGNKHTAKFLLENKAEESLKIKNLKGKLPLQEGLFDYLQPLTFGQGQ